MSMENKKYEILSHTADFKIKFFGKSYSELINSVFKFYFDILEVFEEEDYKEEKVIEILDESFEFIAVRLINELIFYKDIGKFIQNYEIISISEKRLKLKVILCNGVINFKYELKSATYYNLNLKKINDCYYLEMVIDI